MKSSRSGFTLVETIFATLFIGMTVLAIVNLFPGAYLSIRRSETTIQADLVAKSIIDEWRLVPFAEIEPGEYPGHSLPSEFESSLLEPKNLEGINYTPRVRIYDVPGVAASGPKGIVGIVVTVQYRLGFSVKEVVHETYLHKLIR